MKDLILIPFKSAEVFLQREQDKVIKQELYKYIPIPSLKVWLIQSEYQIRIY